MRGALRMPPPPRHFLHASVPHDGRGRHDLFERLVVQHALLDGEEVQQRQAVVHRRALHLLLLDPVLVRLPRHLEHALGVHLHVAQVHAAVEEELQQAAQVPLGRAVVARVREHFQEAAVLGDEEPRGLDGLAGQKRRVVDARPRRCLLEVRVEDVAFRHEDPALGPRRDGLVRPQQGPQQPRRVDAHGVLQPLLLAHQVQHRVRVQLGPWAKRQLKDNTKERGERGDTSREG